MSASKRGRPEGEEEPDFATLVDGLRTEVIDYVNKNLQSTAQHLTSNITGLVIAHDKKCEKRFFNIEKSLTGSSLNTIRWRPKWLPFRAKSERRNSSCTFRSVQRVTQTYLRARVAPSTAQSTQPFFAQRLPANHCQELL